MKSFKRNQCNSAIAKAILLIGILQFSKLGKKYLKCKFFRISLHMSIRRCSLKNKTACTQVRRLVSWINAKNSGKGIKKKNLETESFSWAYPISSQCFCGSLCSSFSTFFRFHKEKFGNKDNYLSTYGFINRNEYPDFWSCGGNRPATPAIADDLPNQAFIHGSILQRSWPTWCMHANHELSIWSDRTKLDNALTSYAKDAG